MVVVVVAVVHHFFFGRDPGLGFFVESVVKAKLVWVFREGRWVGWLDIRVCSRTLPLFLFVFCGR